MTGYERHCVHMRYPKQTTTMIIEQLKNSNEPFKFSCPSGATCPLSQALISHVPNNFILIPSQKTNENPFLKALMRLDPASQLSVCSHDPKSNISYTGPGFACSIHGIMDLEIPVRLTNTPVHQEPIYSTPCNYRIWENIKINKKQESSGLFRFKVLSYNVLSEILLQPNFKIEYNENKERAWRLKSERIYNEVLKLDPDIICFQEVQVSHSEFYRRFNDIGYRGVFKKKTRQRVDGCAILFKDSVFEMNERVGVEYYQPKCQILNTNNVGILAKLTSRVCSKTIVIASTHLSKSKKQSSQEGYSATRIAELRILLHELEKFVGDGKRLPLILTGDFNSTRHSEAIKLLIEGQIIIPIEHSLEHLGLKESFLEQYYSEDIYDGFTFSAPPPQFKEVKHPFRFVSVYHMNRRESQQLQGWVAIDYMFFTGALKAVQRLRPPPIRRKKNGLFNIFNGNMALAVVFEMKP